MNRIQALALLALAPAALAAQPIPPFEADYEVLRNGSTVGEARMRLSQEGATDWRLHASLSASAAGGLLRFSSVEDSRFHWHEGELRSDRYHARRQQPLRTRERGLEFDWNAGRVTATDRRGEQQRFDLDESAVDPQLSLLVAMLAASRGEAEFDYVMVHRGAPERQRGRSNGERTVTTGLGEVSCIEIERIRENSDRVTRSCHAESLDWLPVHVLQIEDDDELEMRLKSLVH